MQHIGEGPLNVSINRMLGQLQQIQDTFDVTRDGEINLEDFVSMSDEELEKASEYIRKPEFKMALSIEQQEKITELIELVQSARERKREVRDEK